MEFYDLKTKVKFESDEFEVIAKEKNNRITRFAIADAPSGIKSYKIISKAVYEELKAQGK